MSTAIETPPREIEDQWQDLASKGYAVRSFLAASEIEELRHLYEANTSEVSSPLFLSVFLPVEARRKILEGFRVILADKLSALAPGFQIVGASFVTKKAGSVNGRLGLHQDCSLVDSDKHLGINVWVPLCDVDMANGCLRVAGKSQQFNLISCLPPWPSPCADFERELTAPYTTSLEMKAGEACLFDARLLHGSEENHSDHDRVAAFFNLIPDGLPVRLNFRSPKLPNRLRSYHVDSEFILQLDPLVELDDSKLGAITLVASFEYAQPRLSMADFAALYSEVPWTPAAIPATETPDSTRPAGGGTQPSLWRRTLRIFRLVSGHR